MREVDVAVIGNGVIALSIAYWLQRLECDVRVATIGPRRSQGCASRAAGAMLGHFGEVVAHPGRSDALDAKFRLGRQATAMWPGFLEELAEGSAPGLAPRIEHGTFVILSDRSSDAEVRNFRAILDALLAEQEPYHEVYPREIQGLAPDDQDTVCRALFLPREGYVASARVLEALERRLSLTPTQIQIEDRALSVQAREDGRHVISLASTESMIASVVVIAAGADSQSLIESIGDLATRVQRLVSGVGCSAVVEAPISPAAVIRTPNQALGGGLHMVPYAAGCLYLGATNRVAWHPADNPQIDDVVTLLRESKSRFNGELGHSRVVDLRVGNRPMTIDGFPLIGPTSVPGIFIASGTYRSGFHLAPLIGNQIANAVLSPTSAGLESAFLPERRPIDYLSVECAIGVVSESLRATKYGRDHRVEGGGFDETRVRQVYERWANVFVPPPEIYPLFEGDSAFLARLMRDFSVS